MHTPTPFELVIELARNNVTDDSSDSDKEIIRHAELDAIYQVETAHAAMKEALQDAISTIEYLWPEKFDDKQHEQNYNDSLQRMKDALTLAHGGHGS